MTELQVHMDIASPIERVFAALSDHETFLNSLPGISTKVIRPGATERNGLGCLREVRSGEKVLYVEEITKWVRPTMYEYTIRETSIPLRHFGSDLQLKPTGTGTAVVWTSRFQITIPILRPILAWHMKRRLSSAFRHYLAVAKQKLEGNV